MFAVVSAGFPQSALQDFACLPSARSSDAANHPRYWPSDLLHAFTLHMAGQGYCVNSSMMLGDPSYALEKLSLAHTCNDEKLRELAMCMFSYFDSEAWAAKVAPQAPTLQWQ